MPTASDVSRLLRLKFEFNDFSDFVPHIRNGFPRECFDDFVSETNIATAITRLSAFRDLSDDSMRLTSEASDCLLRVARIYAEAFDLFGVSSDVASWMQTESQTLGDETPLELLDTSVGFELVFHELKRLQYGIAG